MQCSDLRKSIHGTCVHLNDVSDGGEDKYVSCHYVKDKVVEGYFKIQFYTARCFFCTVSNFKL